MERTPKSGEFYRHFKDKLYQIITVAEHTETGEPLVIYQALYGDYRTYARPLIMFVGEVDHVKYPHVIQKYRFEKVVFTKEEGSCAFDTECADCQAVRGCGGQDTSGEIDSREEEPVLNPYLLSFIEAETYDERMECIGRMRGHLGQEDLDIIYVALDMHGLSGTLEEQLQGVEQYLKMQRHYDGGRLR